MNTLVKPILLGGTLLLTVAFTGAFDFQMPDEEETPQSEPTTSESSPKKSPKKVSKKPKKKSKKPQSKAEKKAQKIKKAAKVKATQAATRPESRGIQEQIRLLNEKIDRLESGYLPNATPAACVSAKNPTDRTGYIPIAGTNTALRIGGYIKIDGIYDANQYTGADSNLPNLLLKGLDAGASQSNVFSAHAKQTRLTLGSETNTAHGQVMAYFEGDFFGTTNFGTSNGSFSRSDSSSLNSYNFRVRHAYGSYCYDTHRVDIGQMWTLFYDPRSAGTTIEFNGPETTAQIRRPQIRYAFTYKTWKISASIESGATEYLDVSPAFVGTVATKLTAGSPSTTYNSSQYRRAQSSFLGGVTGDGSQALPDLVAQVQYEKKDLGHFTLGGMLRELSIKKITTTGTNDPIFSRKKYGYGVALGGRMFIHGKSNIFAQMNFGKGIGTYIFGLDGYGAALDVSRGLMQTQFCYGALIGVEHYWSDKWRTNLIYSQARANVSDIIPAGRAPVKGLDGNNNVAILATTGYSISSMLRQFYINLLWAPLEKVEVGVEYAFFRRDTVNNYFGYGNRFQFGAYYKF